MCTLILNFLILISFNDKKGKDQRFDISSNKNYFLSFGILMLVSSILVVSFFLIRKIPLFLKDAWRESQVTKAEYRKLNFFGKFILIIMKMITIIVKFIQEIEIIYYIAYGVFAYLGVSRHPFFFAFHMTEVLLIFPTLKNVIKSIWIPKY